MSRTGVVVVTYNSEDVIGQCLDACAFLPAVVVDNASQDNTIEEVRKRPAVQLIANASNRGFAAAVNQGTAALGTEFVLLVNPDVTLQTGVTELETSCSQSGAAMATGKLLSISGSVQRGFSVRKLPTPAILAFEVLGLNRLFPWNWLNRSYRCLDFEFAAQAYVEQPPGAFLLFRREIWKRLGGFDEQFHPLWFEDVDFCKRARDLNYKCVYVPSVSAVHRGAHSIGKLDWNYRELCWYVSLLKYASKHFRRYAFRGLSAAVVLGSVFRVVTGMIQKRSLKP